MLAAGLNTSAPSQPAPAEAVAQVPGRNWNKPAAWVEGFSAFGSPADSQSITVRASSTMSAGQCVPTRDRHCSTSGGWGAGAPVVVVVPGSGAAVVVVGATVVVVGAAVVVGGAVVVSGVVVGGDVVAGATVVVGGLLVVLVDVVVVALVVVGARSVVDVATNLSGCNAGGCVCGTGLVRSWLAMTEAATRPDATGGSTMPSAVAEVSTGSDENAANPITASSKMTTTNATGERFRTSRGSALCCGRSDVPQHMCLVTAHDRQDCVAG